MRLRDHEDADRSSSGVPGGAWLVGFMFATALALGCGKVSSATPDGSGTDAALTDAPAAPADAAHLPDGSQDAGTHCDPTAPFGAPVLLAGFHSSSKDEGPPRLSPDELTLYLWEDSPANLYVAQRTATDQPFNAPVKLTSVDSTANDNDPTVSSDGLILIFGSDRAAMEGSHIYVSTRTSTLGNFGAASELSGVNSATVTDDDAQPFLTADGQQLWFASNRTGGAGGFDIYRATKSGADFANPQPVTELNSAANDELPVLSADGLTVYFASNRPGGKGSYDIWTSHRSTTADGFPTPVPVTELNTSAADYAGWLSADNCRLYLASTKAGTFDVYVATRQP